MLFSSEKLTFTYPNSNRAAVSEATFSLSEGEFVTLCGVSGCGKSTLLRLMKPCLSPRGKISGDILFNGAPLNSLSARESACAIGYVAQHPEAAIVTDRVWHELAFSLESVGVPQAQLRRRVAECAQYFGLEDCFERETASLSGGEKQLLALASAAALRPRLLLLDEPTSQLDPIAARNFIDTAHRLCRELGITVLIAEHRLEELLPISDRVIVMERGRIIADCPPRRLSLPPRHEMLCALPAAARIAALSESRLSSTIPLTIAEGRQNAAVCAYLRENAPKRSAPPVHDGKPLIAARELYFGYERGTEVLQGASLELFKGEIYALLGGNGSGKSTLLKALCGIIKPHSGKTHSQKGLRLAYLPQEPCALFGEESASSEFSARGISDEEKERLCELFGLSKELLALNPLDLSGGERQRLALALLLAGNPDALLLDEPTKGMDAAGKQRFSKLLSTIKSAGTSVLLVTHDAEFAALCADRCGLLFRGEVVSEDIPSVFFRENTFYTTPLCRLSRGIAEGWC